jgi:hypothetical protein
VHPGSLKGFGLLSAWESLPCVRRLDERLYDWNTTINALAG